jgi:hypothetical protein
VRDGLADHWIEILGLDVWQVNESCGVGRLLKRIVVEILDYTH